MTWWHLLVAVVLAFISGTFAGYGLFRKTHRSDGIIFVSAKDDGSESIRFVLPVEYDEIPMCKQITFNVKKEDGK